MAAVVGRNMIVFDSPTTIAGGIPTDEFHADVDGDGDVFLAVFQVHEGRDSANSIALRQQELHRPPECR